MQAQLSTIGGGRLATRKSYSNKTTTGLDTGHCGRSYSLQAASQNQGSIMSVSLVKGKGSSVYVQYRNVLVGAKNQLAIHFTNSISFP